MSKEIAPIDARWLVERCLADQQDMTAVERFAELHAASALAHDARAYRELVPLTAPGPGEQYAFEVDLDACSGCKACVVACHNLNGLDEKETWRSVGLLVSTDTTAPVLQHVTSACHHCGDPACLSGCPVGAYEKDPVTGIVRHLDDQCIGCRYCMLTCPYDVPSFNERLGIVRKCDMCHGRLAVGEAPACVDACPAGAIRVTKVSRATIESRAREGHFLPAAANPTFTHPSTHFLRAQPLPESVVAGDEGEIRGGESHTPLVFMLVLTQLAVGAFAVGLLVSVLGPPGFDAVRPIHATASMLAGLLAIGASTLHLGRPLHAWRAFLGLRTSWLSREVLAFGLFAQLAVTDAALGLSGFGTHVPGLEPLLGVAVVASGFFGVLCSVLLYARTQRPFWHWPRTAAKFALTTASLGIATTLCAGVLGAAVSPRLHVAEFVAAYGPALIAGLAATAATKLLLEASFFRHRDRRTALGRSAALLGGELYQKTAARFALGWIGGVAVPILLLVTGVSALPLGLAVFLIALACGLTLAGELLERHLFFRAVTAPSMPGAIAA